VEPVVVAGIADDDHVGGVHDLEQAGKEPGRTDAARERHDHGSRVAIRLPRRSRDRFHKGGGGSLSGLMGTLDDSGRVEPVSPLR
jgi:hypothetical protein